MFINIVAIIYVLNINNVSDCYYVKVLSVRECHYIYIYGSFYSTMRNYASLLETKTKQKTHLHFIEIVPIQSSAECFMLIYSKNLYDSIALKFIAGWQ